MCVVDGAEREGRNGYDGKDMPLELLHGRRLDQRRDWSIVLITLPISQPLTVLVAILNNATGDTTLSTLSTRSCRADRPAYHATHPSTLDRAHAHRDGKQAVS